MRGVGSPYRAPRELLILKHHNGRISPLDSAQRIRHVRPPHGPSDEYPEPVLLRDPVAHLRQNRTQLREEWARRITEARLLTAMSEDEVFAEATSVYDNYVEALETATFEALQAYARNLSERIISRGVDTHEIVAIVPQGARQLTEQLLQGIRSTRAKVVVIDITDVAALDANVANHPLQTVEASRPLGATAIVTGPSPEMAQTLVKIGVDPAKMNTVGDLQGDIEQAERLLGYKVVPATGARELPDSDGCPERGRGAELLIEIPAEK